MKTVGNVEMILSHLYSISLHQSNNINQTIYSDKCFCRKFKSTNVYISEVVGLVFHQSQHKHRNGYRYLVALVSNVFLGAGTSFNSFQFLGKT